LRLDKHRNIRATLYRATEYRLSSFGFCMYDPKSEAFNSTCVSRTWSPGDVARGLERVRSSLIGGCRHSDLYSAIEYWSAERGRGRYDARDDHAGRASQWNVRSVSGRIFLGDAACAARELFGSRLAVSKNIATDAVGHGDCDRALTPQRVLRILRRSIQSDSAVTNPRLA
jgi:hypothetical protein